MGFWDWFTDDVLGINPPDTSAQQQQLQNSINAQTAALTTSTASAKASADAALKAQQDANLLAQAAGKPAADSESARTAADNELKKRLSGNSYNVGLPTQFGAPPVGFRLLSGQ